ncbi:MAG: carboxymuconolactone decarboxylase family protein [Myxococcaceae bacterium]
MSAIKAIEANRAGGQVSDLLGAVKKMMGGTPNTFLVAAQAPSALESMVAQFGATAHGTLKPKVRESIALAVAETNGCDYCLSAHAALAKGAGLSPEQIDDARQAASDDAKTNAILRFSRELVLTRGHPGAKAHSELRAAGVSDTEVLEIVTNVALNVFTNYLNLVAGTEIDFPILHAGQPGSKAA